MCGVLTLDESKTAQEVDLSWRGAGVMQPQDSLLVTIEMLRSIFFGILVPSRAVMFYVCSNCAVSLVSMDSLIVSWAFV